MPRIPALIACLLVGVIACVTAWTWMYLIGAHTLTAGSVIVCTIVAVAVSLAVEAAAKAVRRRRRPASPRHRKAGV